ncbi:hypothetical protein FISHEDRAFT_65989 [Fistulina hepatica ATCC 64428]|uniref:TLC domain-containing protein n=1 Tax=Fistulina hepatica ATCC 64428 TaxID=1128425 RepID=A0A0D7ABE4_9AGAR|nr:hypothetical protein FISHEDRAFT_65989 [Fistulina hepatica ATCC 64428]
MLLDTPTPAYGVFIPSLLFLCSVYLFLSRHYPHRKTRSWILTTWTAAFMSIFSLPYLRLYLATGTRASHTFFQAYLLSDLTIGAFQYREHINMSTGWIHHMLYIVIVEYAIRNGWAHVFCLCAIMELPTFLLGLAHLHPQLRANILFAVSFFTTRILFHIIVCVSYLTPCLPHIPPLLKLSSVPVDPFAQSIPGFVLAVIFPMHAIWFRGCIRGFVHRHHARGAVQVVVTSKPLSKDADSSLRLRIASWARAYALRGQGMRRQRLLRAWHIHRARETGIHVRRVISAYRATVWDYIPTRDRLFNFVGLGPPSSPGQGSVAHTE